MLKHPLHAVLCALLLSVSLAGCAAEKRQAVNQVWIYPLSKAAGAVGAVGGLVTPEGGPPPLKVGVSPTSPPMIFVNRSSDIDGVEADLAKLLSERIGRPIRFIRIPWDEQIASLRRGRIDVIMSAMSITAAREQQVDFCKPYLQTGQSPMIRFADRFEFLSYESIFATKKRVGVERATTGEDLVRGSLLAAKIKTFTKVEDAGRALAKKKLDVVIHDEAVLRYYARQNPQYELIALSLPLTREEYAWAVRKDDHDLQATLNEALAAWQRDGQLRTILQKWLR